MKHSDPKAQGLPGRGWTLKKLGRWIAEKLGRRMCRNTIGSLLKQAGLSWKKCKKLLGKADPNRRAEYLKTFEQLYRQMCAGEVVLVFLDESHFHRDLDLGYTWAPVGQRVWRVSDCPSLSERLNWYGAYNFTSGQCLIWHEGQCNTLHTGMFLERVARWLGSLGRRIVLIWDGAPCHRANILKEQAQALGLELLPLPGYSPDLNPIEGLWKWMREEVTQHECYANLQKLSDACERFIESINRDPLGIISRLWPKFALDPELEKLRISN